MRRHPILRHAIRGAVIVAGVLLLIAGVLMLVLPGPGILAMVVALGLLGREFPWARNLSQRLRNRLDDLRRRPALGIRRR